MAGVSAKTSRSSHADAATVSRIIIDAPASGNAVLRAWLDLLLSGIVSRVGRIAHLVLCENAAEIGSPNMGASRPSEEGYVARTSAQADGPDSLIARLATGRLLGHASP